MHVEDNEVGELLAEESPRAEFHHVPKTNSKRTPTQNTVTAAYQLTGWRKWALIVAAGALAAGASICISKSKVHGTQLYNPVTCTLLSECIKFAGTTLALLCGCRIRQSEQRDQAKYDSNAGVAGATTSTDDAMPERVCIPLFCRDSWPFAVPAALYAIDNNLAFLVLRFISPATMSLVWNVKILQTSLLFRFFLGRRLTLLRWLSIGLLFCGVVGSQSHSIKSGHDGTHARTADGIATADEFTRPASSYVVGIGLVLVCTTISALAGIYSEYVLKRGGERSNFLHQQLHFYSYGIVVNGAALLVKDHARIAADGFFVGYNQWTVAAVLFISCMGLATASIFKFLDNVMNVYTQAVAMIITTTVSALWLGFKLNVAFVCGATVCMIAMYIYNEAPGKLLSGGEQSYYDNFSRVHAAGSGPTFSLLRVSGIADATGCGKEEKGKDITVYARDSDKGEQFTVDVEMSVNTTS